VKEYVRCIAMLVVLFAPLLASAQESQLQADVRREGERVSDACSFDLKAIPSCAYTLFTDHPFHIATGSMPPQNGFGFGAAFVWSENTENWRLSWDADAVGATSGAWRAGAYMTIVHTPHPKKNPIEVITPPTDGSTQPQQSVSPLPKASENFTHPYTVYNIYAQSISLNKLNYFGLGNDTILADKTVFGMSQTIIGGSAIKPVYEWSAIRKLNLALLAEINGRFVDIRGNHNQSVPSIETFFTDATAPGLTNQPGFFQLGEGLRIKPVFGNFELNYMGKFQQYFAPSDSHSSFLRWTLDFNHTYYLYGHSSPTSSSNTLGPDSCAASREDACPPIPRTRNLNGSLGMRLFISESINSATSAVPFYFQPTLGGQDIDSSLALGSYQDYRFRAPNIFLLQENFEHSVWGPFGVKFTADQGKVALTRGDVDFSNFKHSFAAGLTLRAGAFPMVTLMYAWGGPEGQHTIANMNTSLLGGSARPSLF
jgi:hypothetical protein